MRASALLVIVVVGDFGSAGSAAESDGWSPVEGCAIAHSLRMPGKVGSLAFGRGGALLAVQAAGAAKGSQTVELRSAATGAVEKVIEKWSEPVYSVTFSPDSAQVVAAVWMNKGPRDATGIRVWNTGDGKQVRWLTYPRSEEHGLTLDSDFLRCTYSADGKLIAAGGKLTSEYPRSGEHVGGRLCVWEAASGKLLWQTDSVHTDIIYAVAASPTSGLLASGGIDKLVRIWDFKSGELKRTLFGAAWQGIASLAFSKDGRFLASGGMGEEEGDQVRIWEVETGKLVRTLSGFKRGGTIRVAFAADGVLLATGQAADATEPTWQLKRCVVPSGKSMENVFERRGYSRAIAASGSICAVGTESGDVIRITVK